MLKFEESRFTGSYSRNVYQTLYWAYRPIAVGIVLCAITGFIGRALLLANTNLIGYWVDSLCTGPRCKPVPSWLHQFTPENYLVALGVLTLLGFLCVLTFRVIFSRLSSYAVSHLYDEVTMRVSRYPISFFDTTPAGRIMTRFSSDYQNVFRMFGGPLAELMSISFDLISMIILVAVASPYYLVICAVIGVLNYFVFRSNRDPLRVERRQLSRNRSPSIAHFAETAQGASTIRAFLRQVSFRLRFAKLDQLFLNQKLRTQKKILFFSFQMSSLTALLLLLTGIAGYYMSEAGIVSVGSLGVAFSFIALSGNTIQAFFEWMAQFEEAMIGVERLDQYLRNPMEPGLYLPQAAEFQTAHQRAPKVLPDSPLAGKHQAGLRFKDVWLRYGPDLPYVLKGVNFEVQAGERLGIIGRTGSGKSSLIQALFYLYPCDKGRIEVDGLSPETIDLTQYRQSLALIAQEPVLFRGRLRENLSLDPNRTDEELLEALCRVGLAEGQIGGLDSMIEERGRNLSMGERQLVCMARCLLQNSPVIVMDEATSSVDPQSEEILVRATYDFFSERTQLIVAHRLSTLRHCHRILWLQNGEVHMLGTADEVLPVFAKSQLSI